MSKSLFGDESYSELCDRLGVNDNLRAATEQLYGLPKSSGSSEELDRFLLELDRLLLESDLRMQAATGIIREFLANGPKNTQ